tara:strand:+ start:216 stop:740 length:525 start_codon:yes stop_codon:yes gene_type:complete
MKITKTFYYQYGSEFIGTQSAIFVEDYFVPPSAVYATVLNPDDIAHIPINIPFKVRTIHVKNITYVRGMAGNQGAYGITPSVSFYINFLATLVGNRPVGMVHADSQFSMNTSQDIKHTFMLPQEINGTYDFTIYKNDGVRFTPWQFEVNLAVPEYYYFFDRFSITIEFNSEYEE